MKKYFLGLVALAMAVAFSAFTNVPASKTVAVGYYVFNGADDSELGDVAKWQTIPLSQRPEQCEDTNEAVCFISSEKTQSQFISFINANPSLTRIQLEAEEVGTNILSTRD